MVIIRTADVLTGETVLTGKTMEFQVLGPFEVRRLGETVRLSPKSRILLAVLLCRPNVTVPSDLLVDALWGDDPPQSVATCLRIHLHHLRQALGTWRIRREPAGFTLTVDPAELDALQFQRLADQGRADIANGDIDQGAALLGDALRRWRGPAYGGMEALPMARKEATRLNEQRQAVAVELMDAQLTLGRDAEIVAELAALVREYPYREDLRAQLMTALHRLGRTDEALASYREGTALLAEDLGLEPGPRLRQVRLAIRTGGALPDVGSGQPESSVPAELPQAPDVFAGRTAELAILDAAFHDPSPTLLVTGVAGVGKTGLALRGAHRALDRFPDGQLYVDLRGQDDRRPPATPGAVLERFLRGLGVPADRIPIGVDERSALFRSTVQDRELLVLLDNAVSAAQVRPLLPAGPGCAVVVTARAPLAGLVADGFRPLALSVLTDQETTELLIEVVGADRVAAEPAAARRLGELCDRIPLALRIIAAKLASRPERTLADLVDQLSHEHGRLDQLRRDDWHVRASFELSYRTLPARPRAAFRRLGLVDAPAGIAPWALAALLDCDLDSAEDLAEQLVDEQLIQSLGTDPAGQRRYRFHDLIRLYAAERASAEEPSAERTAALERVYWMLARGLSGRSSDAWFDAERHTVAAAVAGAAGQGLEELSWQLAITAAFGTDVEVEAEPFQPVRLGLHLESAPGSVCRQKSELFERLDRARGRVLRLGQAAIRQHRLGEPGWAGESDYQQARALLLEADDVASTIDDLGRQVAAALRTGRGGTATDLLDQALSIAPGTIHQLDIMFLRAIRAFYVHQGRPAEAVHLASRTVELARTFGDPRSEPGAMRGLAEAQLAAGDPDAAWSTVDDAIRVARRIGLPRAEGRALLTLADIDFTHAAAHLSAAAAVFATAGAEDWHRTATDALIRSPRQP